MQIFRKKKKLKTHSNDPKLLGKNRPKAAESPDTSMVRTKPPSRRGPVLGGVGAGAGAPRAVIVSASTRARVCVFSPLFLRFPYFFRSLLLVCVFFPSLRIFSSVGPVSLLDGARSFRGRIPHLGIRPPPSKDT